MFFVCLCLHRRHILLAALREHLGHSVLPNDSDILSLLERKAYVRTEGKHSNCDGAKLPVGSCIDVRAIPSNRPRGGNGPAILISPTSLGEHF